MPMPDTSRQQQHMKKSNVKFVDEQKFASLNGEMLKAVKGGRISALSTPGKEDNLCGNCPYHRQG